MTTATDPIGGLIIAATKQAKKKANGHTSTAECGCMVTVSFFSKDSSTVKIERCFNHPVRRQEK